MYFNSGAGSYTLTGNTINFYNYGSFLPTIENDGANLQTIGIQVDVENNMNVIANAGNLTFSGAGIYIDGSSSVNFSANSGDQILVNEAINNATNGINIGGTVGSSTGAGTVIFAGTNTYTGATSINGGTLQLGNGGTTGSIASGNTIYFNVGSGTSASSGTLAINLTGSSTITDNLVMNSASDWANVAVAAGQTATFTGSITGAGEFWTTGAGTVVITPNSGSAGHTASNVISTGTLQISDFSTSTLGSGGFFIVNGALNYTGPSTSTTRLGSYALQSATSTIGVTTSGTTLTLSNDLGGFTGGALTKTGPGTLALSATNTYVGTTQVNGGVLQVDGSLASGSAVTVGGASASGTPVLAGAGTVNGTVSVAAAGGGAAGTISPGDGNVAGTLSTGAVTFGGGGTWDAYLGNPGTANSVTGSGTSNKLAITGNLSNVSGEIVAPLAASSGTVGAGSYLIGTYSGTDSSLSSVSVNAYGSGSSVLHGVLVDGGAGTTGTAGLYLDEYRLATATAPSSTQALGNVRVGGTLTGTASIANNSANSFSESLQATVTGNGTGFTGVTGGNSGTVNYSVATSAAGPQSGSASVVLASTGVGNNTNTTLSTTSVTLSGAAYDYANANYSGTTLNFGYLHTGATAANQSVAFGNATKTSTAYQDSLNVSATTGNSLVTATGFTALGASTGGTTTNNLTLAANTSTAGSLASTETLNLVSNANGVSGLSNGTPTVVGGGALATTGQVYNGQSTWNTSSSGAWGTITGTTPDANFLANWTTGGGAPGVSGSAFNGLDKATFGSQTSSAITVGLNNAAPNLNSITFSSPATSYTIAQNQGSGTGSNSVTLSGTTPSIAVTSNATAGNQKISAPISLGATTALAVGSNQQLTISGAISGSNGLSNSGAGTTILSSSTGNSYSAGTTISSGIVYVNSGVSGTSSGTGPGAVAVNGGTLAGSGSITTGAGVSINSGATLASGDAQSGATVDGTHLNFTNTQVTLNGDAPANLSFSLSADTTSGSPQPYGFANPSTNSTYMTLTGSAQLNFAINSIESVTLNDLTTPATLSLRQGTPYLLVAGSSGDITGLITESGAGAGAVLSIDGTGYVVGVLTSAGLANESVFTGAGKAGYLTSADYNAITINQVGPSGPLTGTSIYPDTVLYLNGGDLEVVPEPGTWALLLGGLGLLAFFRFRARQA